MGLFYDNYECNPVTNNTTKINAVSGTLTKTYKDSYFVKFDKGSSMEDKYFDENPFRCGEKTYTGFRTPEVPIIVLQVMLCDNGYLVEAIDKDKYEKIFKEKVGE